MSGAYRPGRMNPWRLLSALFRLTVVAVKAWPILLVVALFLSPVVPYLRWTYTYQLFGNERIYLQCNYLGLDGLVIYQDGDQCPLIALLNRRSDRH